MGALISCIFVHCACAVFQKAKIGHWSTCNCNYAWCEWPGVVGAGNQPILGLLEEDPVLLTVERTLQTSLIWTS